MAARPFRLRAARREAAFLALIVGGVAAVVLVVASRMEPGAPTVALTTIASIFLTLAIGGFLYETVLRDSVTGETIQLLGLREAVVTSGLVDVARDSSVDWRDVLEPASDVEVLVTSPFGWLEQSWPHILQAANRRKVKVTVYLPDPKGQVVSVLAVRSARNEADLRSQLETFGDHLRASWENAEVGHSPLRPNSKFALKFYDFAAVYDLVTTDRDVLMRLQSLSDVRPGDPALVLRFGATSDAFPVPWLKDQFERLRSVPSAWEKEVRSGRP